MRSTRYKFNGMYFRVFDNTSNCTDCPNSALCLAGVELRLSSDPISICGNCGALSWVVRDPAHDYAETHVCTLRGLGLYSRHTNVRLGPHQAVLAIDSSPPLNELLAKYRRLSLCEVHSSKCASHIIEQQPFSIDARNTYKQQRNKTLSQTTCTDILQTLGTLTPD